MDRIAVIYATWHGQARDVAQHVADVAAARGLDVDIREAHEAPSLETFTGAVLVGAVHFGRYSFALTRFARRNRAWLADHPCGFLSVSGAAIALQGRQEAEAQIADFLRRTGWRPDISASVAGAILYTKYDPITRWGMKISSRMAGRGTDTSRDYVYTNWFEVDAFTHQFADRIERFRAASGDVQRTNASSAP